MALSQLAASIQSDDLTLILRLLAGTAPSIKSKQIRHKKDKPSPN